MAAAVGVSQDGCAACRERSEPPRPGGHRLGVSEVCRTGDGASDVMVVSGAWSAIARSSGVRRAVWRRPSYGTVYRILRNPMYGGAYAYGKTERTLHDEHGEPRTSSRRTPRDQWLALIPDAHEGYVSWNDFERIQQAVAENQRGWGHTGAVSNGPALLAGLLRCRRCGRKLTSGTLPTPTRWFEPASSQPPESVPLRKSRPNLAVDVVAECADAFRSSYWTLRRLEARRSETAAHVLVASRRDHDRQLSMTRAGPAAPARDTVAWRFTAVLLATNLPIQQR